MRCPRPFIPTSVITAAVVLLASGCGGGARSSATAAATAPQTGALAFATCMHSHGVRNWPDPSSSGQFRKPTRQQLGVGGSVVRAAANACQHLLPNGGGAPPETAQQIHTRLLDGLAFARCMRARGFPSFPDPTNQGELTVEMVTAAGIDLHQPQLLRAGLACVPVTHGLLTPAAIERAVSGS